MLPDLDARISSYFRWREFIREEDKHLVTPIVLANIRTLVWFILDPARRIWNEPIRVTSGFRSPEHNFRVGGARYSDHLFGAAADLQPSSVLRVAHSYDRITNFSRVLQQYRPFKLIVYSRHVHVSIPSWDLTHHPSPYYRDTRTSDFDGGTRHV